MCNNRGIDTPPTPPSTTEQILNAQGHTAKSLRPDGTSKGTGWLGTVPKEGFASHGIGMTELTADDEVNGKNLQFPLIVPTLTKAELDHLSAGKKPTDAIYDKAIRHALERKKKGLSVYHD